MTKFKLTEELALLIRRSNLKLEKKNFLLKSDVIGNECLVRFYQECKPTASLLQLLKTTQVVIPNKNLEKEKTPKTAEFTKSMEYLRLKAQEEDYQKLVNPTLAMNTLYKQVYEEPLDRVRQHKETKSHITTMFNIFISVASVVYAIWYWTSSSWAIRDSYRVLLCLFFGIVILVAEVVVYLGYLRRMEEAKIKERNKKEVKKVIRSFTIN